MEAKSSFEAKKNAWTEKSEEWKKNREKQKAELSELSEKYEHLLKKKLWLSAFDESIPGYEVKRK